MKYGEYILYMQVDEDGTYDCVCISSCDQSATGEIVIPSEIDGLPVTSIGDGMRFMVVAY